MTWARQLLLVVALIGAIACTTTKSTANDYPSDVVQPPQPVEEETTDERSPRSVAAQALMDEGRQLLEAGDADRALSRFEQAAAMNPRSGENHYWLAQVWLAKGDAEQAREHHRLANRYLSTDAAWKPRIEKQGRELDTQ